MSEEDSGQEKTEDPTAQRQEKSREEGQIPRSRELGTTTLLLTAAVSMALFGPNISVQLQKIIEQGFIIPREKIFDPNAMILQLEQGFFAAFWAVLPVFAMLLIAVSLSTLMIGGWLFTTKAVMPKFSRIGPLSGLKRMFSKQSLMELVKALLKFILVAGASLVILNMIKGDLFIMANEPVKKAMEHSLMTLLWVSTVLSASTILIALIDVPFQIYSHNQKLKMTMQQVKDEMKDSEGKPEVKSKIRQLQREMAQSRMMGKVPEADVVITNPTHYSVALAYDPLKPGAPIVLAKGADFIALKIREIAVAHEVLIVEAPPLARAVYHTTEIGDEIPADLYLAVAQVLAYVYQIRKYSKGRAGKPNPLADLDIPSNMKFDE